MRMSVPPIPEALLLYAGFAALVLSLVLSGCVIYLSLRLRRLTMGGNGSIEDALRVIATRTKTLEEFRTELEKYLATAEVRLSRAIQGVATVRFNPFGGEGLGGNQSFATAFIDEHGTGIVISTLYSRDRVSIYGKPLVKGASPYELTQEERQAIAEATGSLAQKKRA